jgi:hypothetical protein
VGLARWKEKDDYIKCKISHIDKVYKGKFSKFLSYQWVVKYIVPSVGKITTSGLSKISTSSSASYFKIHSYTCIQTINEYFKNWVEFSNFFKLIFNNGHIKWHVIQTFLDLSPNSLISCKFVGWIQKP